MKKLTDNNTFTFIALLTLVAFSIHGCDTTSSGDDHEDHEDEHSDAFGFVIEENNTEIIRFQNNQFIWNPSGNRDDYFREEIDEALVLSPDVVHLSEENPSGLTSSVTIRWVDQDGDLFDLPGEADGGEYRVDWEWEKPNIQSDECTEDARTEPDQLNEIRSANIEQLEDDGSWGFHFRADHAGEDRVRFRLMHGPDASAHPDFVSGWMHVIVADDNHDLIDENGIYQHNRDKCRTR